MQKLKKIFGGINLSWPKLILFAIIAGIYTALVCIIPIAKETSFHTIAVTLEVWILFGIIIIMNSKSNLDAALKCFVFFLISQPLVYLIQVPFSSFGWHIFQYYPFWFALTIVCFPMGFVGYYIKKGKWWSYLILLPMILLTASEFHHYFTNFIYCRPFYILISIFCAVCMIIYPLVLFDDKKIRITGLIVSGLLIIGIIIASLLNPITYSTSLLSEIDGKDIPSGTQVYLEDKKYGNVSIAKPDYSDSNMVLAEFKRRGKTKLIIKTPDGTEKIYDLNIGLNTYDLKAESDLFLKSTDSFEFTQESSCANEIPEKDYPEFFLHAKSTGFTIPALLQNFVPQGIDFWKEENVFIISGYFKPTDYYQYAVLFAVDAESGKYVGEWKLLNTDGTPHSGHDGGVAITEKDIYLSVAYTLHRISKEQIRNVGNHGNLKFDESIPDPVKASYANFSNDILWVGEFSLKGDPNYTIKGHDYGENHAFTVGYRLDKEGKLSKDPSYVISSPEKVQGFTMLPDSRIFMTTSYGRTNDSTIYISEKSIFDFPAGDVSLNGKKIPLYYTDSYQKIKSIPMNEGVCTDGNFAYFICESGAKNYAGAKNPTDKIWRISND